MWKRNKVSKPKLCANYKLTWWNKRHGKEEGWHLWEQRSAPEVPVFGHGQCQSHDFCLPESYATGNFVSKPKGRFNRFIPPAFQIGRSFIWLVKSVLRLGVRCISVSVFSGFQNFCLINAFPNSSLSQYQFLYDKSLHIDVSFTFFLVWFTKAWDKGKFAFFSAKMVIPTFISEGLLKHY